MLKILFLFVVICVVTSVFKAILGALKDVTLTVMSIDVIVAAVAFSGLLILPFLPLLLSFSLWILAILAGFFAFGCVITLFEK